jgi:hypothetical protein
MQTVYEGVNARVHFESQGVTIENKLFGRKKTIGWSEIGAVHVEPGNWLSRPKMFIMTRAEVAFSDSGVRLLQKAAAGQNAEWFVVGDAAELERVKAAIEARARSSPPASPRDERPATGEAVSVLWSDGQRYRAVVVAAEDTRLLVAFPNGSQQWVASDFVART